MAARHADEGQRPVGCGSPVKRRLALKNQGILTVLSALNLGLLAYQVDRPRPADQENNNGLLERRFRWYRTVPSRARASLAFTGRQSAAFLGVVPRAWRS